MSYISLPQNESELRKLWTSNRKHPALKLAYDALKMKRSPKQAFVLLLGLSGAGKSSSTNYLFGQPIAPTSDQRSETRSTLEYKVTMTSAEWKIKDLTLSIIDTPGFCDTEGLEQDAKNMVCIQNFLKNHPYLQGRFPNLVFLIINIQDNRIEGTNSQFSKMLRGVAQMNAIDQNNPNVVVVLTHAASLGIGKRWNEKAEKKTEEVKAIVETYLGITPEVVVQENLPEDYGLDEDGPWHVLPNGTRQPRHLYDKCSYILNNSQDGLGHEAVAVCFRTDSEKNIYPGLEVSSSAVSKTDAGQMHAALLQSVIAVSDSEICMRLDEYNQAKNIPALNNDILILKVRFRDLNITETRDIQSVSLNTLKARMLPIHMTSRMENILEEVFGLKYEQVTGHVSHIGKSFNILSDTTMEISPLSLEGIGRGKLGLPENVTVNTCSQYDIKCNLYENKNEYVKGRLQELNANLGTEINYGLFQMSAKGGCHIKSSSKAETNTKRKTTSFSIEQKKYKLSLQRPFKISSDLKRDFESLPSTYDSSNESNVEKWKSFFEKWGFHAVIGSYLGGSVTGKMIVEGNMSQEEATQEAQVDLALKFSYLANQADFTLNNTSSSSETDSSRSKSHSTSLQWNGGDSTYFRGTLEQVGIEDWEKWRNSLEHSPEQLWSSLDLCPLYQLMESFDANKVSELRKATKLALGGTLRYEKPAENSRNDAAPSNSSGGGCFPQNATVFLVEGIKKQMQEIDVGDRIWAVDSNGNIIEDEIISWIHKDKGSRCEFLEILHEFGSIVITKDHIIMIGERRTPTLASEVCLGDLIHFADTEGEYTATSCSMVVAMKNVIHVGIYAPLTRRGFIIVNDVAVSCYCTLQPISMFGLELVSGHTLAHFGFLPLRLAHAMSMDINKDALDKTKGIHMYAKWLMDNALGWLKLLSKTD